MSIYNSIGFLVVPFNLGIGYLSIYGLGCDILRDLSELSPRLRVVVYRPMDRRTWPSK